MTRFLSLWSPLFGRFLFLFFLDHSVKILLIIIAVLIMRSLGGIMLSRMLSNTRMKIQCVLYIRDQTLYLEAFHSSFF